MKVELHESSRERAQDKPEASVPCMLDFSSSYVNVTVVNVKISKLSKMNDKGVHTGYKDNNNILSVYAKREWSGFAKTFLLSLRKRRRKPFTKLCHLLSQNNCCSRYTHPQRPVRNF